MQLPDRRALIACLLACLALFSACGGRAISKKAAQELIVQPPLGLLDKEEVYIRSVSQTGQRDALVEATLHVAFRFEKADGKWVIREVRLGKRPWEKLEDIQRALQIVKAEETRKALEQVAAAVDRYRAKKGILPEFRDYVALSDALHPDYLTPLLRLDAWQNPFAAYRISQNTIRLASAGPDGKPGTSDDIELTRTF
jgi:thioesterase domain-containing protein